MYNLMDCIIIWWHLLAAFFDNYRAKEVSKEKQFLFPSGYSVKLCFVASLRGQIGFLNQNTAPSLENPNLLLTTCSVLSDLLVDSLAKHACRFLTQITELGFNYSAVSRPLDHTIENQHIPSKKLECKNHECDLSWIKNVSIGLAGAIIGHKNKDK